MCKHMAEKRDFTLSKKGDFIGRMRLRKMSNKLNSFSPICYTLPLHQELLILLLSITLDYR